MKIMKNFCTPLLTIILVFGFWTIQGQVNTKVASGTNIKGSKLANSFKPVTLAKVDSKTLEKMTERDLKKSKVTEIKVPTEYFNRRSSKRWVLTPKKPFTKGPYGNVSFAFSGSYWWMWFNLQRQFIGNQAMAFVGRIEMSVRKDKQYLITIKTKNNLKSNNYVNIGISPTVTYRMSRVDENTLAAVFKSNHSGNDRIHISALHKQGESERYPEDLKITKILIDEL